MSKPIEIIPGLYLGSKLAAADREALRDCGITAVLNTAREIPCYHKDDPDVRYMELEMNDDADDDIASHFDGSIAFIRHCIEQGGAVLVHCQAGISRSASIVIAYLMATGGASLREAFMQAKEKSSNLQPNQHFFAALQRFEKSLNPDREGPSFSIEQYYTEVLCDMGFPREKAVDALRNSCCDFNLAVSLCLQGS
eukprot:TRINITY_DN33261_c0_g1_i1.p1 TRINITY_DN33261_c0_g1~~TRINITY_DN33261_c0_g1_i1.p1  ORF type:complete len:196 (+),score=69.69 TRINITY_DN33261_c0_g1_i1:75-662(+)